MPAAVPALIETGPVVASFVATSGDVPAVQGESFPSLTRIGPSSLSSC